MNKKYLLVIIALLLPVLGMALEIIPATAADIKSALGPDARGLMIVQDDLPDLFTLTTSRIDENATRFFVEQIYTDGRWKDGKAVIEYARDLSYTIVSIYDNKGRRQRIYSVKTQYGDAVARKKAQTPDLEIADEPPVEQVEEPAPREKKRPKPTRETPPAPLTSVPSGGTGTTAEFEWDEDKGDYVYKGTGVTVSKPSDTAPTETVKTQTPAPTATATESASSRRRRHRRAESTEETASASSSSSSSGDVWVPKTGKSPADSKAAVVAVGGTTWVERKEVGSTVTSTPPPSTRERRPAKKAEPVEVAKLTPPPAERAVDIDKEIPVAPEPTRESRRERRARERREREARESRTAPAEEKVAYVPPSTKKELPAGVQEDHVPSTEELITGEVKPSTKESDAWSPKDVKTPVYVEADAAVESKRPSKRERSRSEERVEDDGRPITAEGDAWVPKDVKQPKVFDPVIPPEKKVAKLPKADNSVEALLKASEKSTASPSKEADTWVPKSAAAPNSTEAALSKEIQRARAEEKQRTAVVAKAVPIRRDINNPEEGVLPVSSFEKFSGPKYGRHREYERRFYPGKRAKSQAPVHDFYVDEVDRRKEFHNIYFYQYQKGKPPKLVAVQRHEKVSFRSNYDIDKEDSGKISVYN